MTVVCETAAVRGKAAGREFALPDLGEGLTEAQILRWVVQVGQRIAVDEPIVEVETAKAVVEIPSPYAGVVTVLWAAEGDTVDVGRPLLTVAEPETPDMQSTPETQGAQNPQSIQDTRDTRDAQDTQDAAGTSGNVLVGYGTTRAPARRARLSPQAAFAPEAMPCDITSRPGTPVPATKTGPSPSGPVPVCVVSPLVRQLARRHGIDLTAVQGSGPGGLIRRADVERATARRAAPPRPAPSQPAPPGTTRIPLRGLRRTVAEKVARSRREIPDATTWVDVDATDLLAVRDAASDPAGPRLPLLALLALVTVAALSDFPQLNSSVDLERREIVRHGPVNLGFAAQTDRGLVVPVIRGAHQLTLAELAAEITRLTTGAREGTLAPADLTGGTFTLNNYGVFGVDGAAPILNHPEAAMLGTGRILPRPWVVDGSVAVRSISQFSLTFDHRVCDGAVAGGFLRRVADLAERPLALLRYR